MNMKQPSGGRGISSLLVVRMHHDTAVNAVHIPKQLHACKYYEFLFETEVDFIQGGGLPCMVGQPK